MILSKFQVYSKVIQLYMCVHACMLSHFSRVALEPYGLYVARQAPLSMGILQTRILEWAAMPSSTGSFQPRD